MRVLWTALCLVLVLEGVLPFLHPAGVKRAWAAGSTLPDATLRAAGLGAMLAGLAMLHLVS